MAAAAAIQKTPSEWDALLVDDRAELMVAMETRAMMAEYEQRTNARHTVTVPGG